ncbi:protein FAR1-RELATED SEQUENCE 5-like [Miscanthus floridulus]|uniref:protein FAR1-RELATED SEQUENCE 5-like n=1 Tax=Miscanthus floridulus TaxID=154761 RepID=UPI003457CCD3
MGPTPPSLVEAGPLALRDPPTASERVAALIQAHRREPPPSSTPMLPPITAISRINYTSCVSAKSEAAILYKNDAYIFYKDYAKLAGFSLRTARTSKETNHWVCNREGKHESKNKEEEAKTEKGSRRCGCPAYVKVKKDGKHNFWFFDHVQEAHNHKLEPSPRMTRYMHAHKNMAEGMSDLFNIMTRNGVPHQAALNVMADLYDGRHMWGFTEKDIKNIECKENNEYFYWDVDADPKTRVIKNIFWSHVSQRAEYKDFGDTITFDTTHKTNSKKMPLAMFVGANNNLKNVTFGQALIDEDPAMKVAIELVFSSLNTETEKLVDECGIADHPAIRALWDKRERWIAAYFKGMYCGRMTSTQRSESQNRVLKDGYVSESTSLHMFARRMLDSLQHTDHMDAGETHYAQTEVVRACKAKFDEQLCRVYTRLVYQKYKKQYNNSTAFIIRPDPDPHMSNGWLVKHEQGGGSFCWAQHEFRVVADKDNGEYRCECKQWEHTGLFCMHIIRAFTHLQVKKIPEKYIQKRYTRSARQEVTWDRHDGVLIGPAASQEHTRMSSLLPKLMKLGRAGSRSDRACQETNKQLDKIIPGIEMFPRSMENGSPGSGPSATESMATTAHPANDETTANGSLGSGPSATGSVVTTTQPNNGSAGLQPSSALLHDGLLLIDPPYSTHKRQREEKEK